MLRQVPFKSILTSVPFWAVCYAGIAASVLMFMVIEMLPKYLSQVQHFDLLNDGFVSGIPFLANWSIGAVACVAADRLRATNSLNNTRIRKLFAVLALTPATIIMCFISTVGCNSTVIVIMICISYGFSGCATAAYTPSLVDMSPRFAGLLHGIADTVYSASGFIVPMIAR